jgi:hypothetical protein
MNPGNVEDKEEYKILKFLLEKFICSQAVLDIVGNYQFVLTKIIHFLIRHVYTWETLYLHYKPRGALPGQDIQLKYSIHHKMVQISMVTDFGGDWIKKRGEHSVS